MKGLIEIHKISCNEAIDLPKFVRLKSILNIVYVFVWFFIYFFNYYVLKISIAIDSPGIFQTEMMYNWCKWWIFAWRLCSYRNMLIKYCECYSEPAKQTEDKSKSGLDALSLICQAVLLDHNYNATLPPDSPTRPAPPSITQSQINGISTNSIYSPGTGKSKQWHMNFFE